MDLFMNVLDRLKKDYKVELKNDAGKWWSLMEIREEDDVVLRNNKGEYVVFGRLYPGKEIALRFFELDKDYNRINQEISDAYSEAKEYIVRDLTELEKLL